MCFVVGENQGKCVTSVIFICFLYCIYWILWWYTNTGWWNWWMREWKLDWICKMDCIQENGQIWGLANLHLQRRLNWAYKVLDAFTFRPIGLWLFELIGFLTLCFVPEKIEQKRRKLEWFNLTIWILVLVLLDVKVKWSNIKKTPLGAVYLHQ